MSLIAKPLVHIMRAARMIQNLTYRTPLIPSETLSKESPCLLKLETLQPTHSFKIRGATNKILNLTDKQRAQGIITVSTGNHGRAVAYVARELGIKATVCISERVPQNKVRSLQELGANVVIHGNSQDDAEVRANELMKAHGYTLIHPFDDADIIAGQGTIGLEILQERPDIDTVLIPLSGGGLISGVALAVKAINPDVRVIGVSMEGSCVMYHSLQSQQPIEMPESDTLADSLLGGIGLDNQYTFSIVQNHVDDIVLVNEEEIARAMAFALHEEQLVVEGAGAVGIAALMSGRIQTQGAVALIISGGNVDMSTLLTIAEKYRS